MGLGTMACGCWWAAGVMEKFSGKRPNFPVFRKNLHARAGGLPIPAPPLIIRQSHREGEEQSNLQRRRL